MHSGHNGGLCLYQSQLPQHAQFQVRKARAFSSPPAVIRHRNTAHYDQINQTHLGKADQLSVLHRAAVEGGYLQRNALPLEICSGELDKATRPGQSGHRHIQHFAVL
jgi:hypothetical protein